MAARAGVEPTTLRLKAMDSTYAPPCPTMLPGVRGFSLICGVFSCIITLFKTRTLYRTTFPGLNPETSDLNTLMLFSILIFFFVLLVYFRRLVVHHMPCSFP